MFSRTHLARHVLVSALLSTTAAAFAPPSEAQTLPDLATVRANIERATGTPPPMETTTTIVTRGQTASTDVRVRSGKDYRVDTTSGPIHTAFGSLAGTVWRQNMNGQVVTNASPAEEPPDPADQNVATVLTHVSDPDDRYVISHLNVDGMGTKSYVDPASWRVVRFERMRPSGVTTRTFADFHTIQGYSRAWRIETITENAADAASYTITSDGVDAIAASALAIPATRSNVVEFPTGKPSISLPVHYDRSSKKFVVRVTIAGRGLDFILDSGAGGIVIDRDVAQSLGLPEYNEVANAANAGIFITTTTIVPEIAIGDLTLHSVAVSTIPHMAQTPGDIKVVGLLGFDFLDAVDARLDYAAGTVTAFDPNHFVPPNDPETIALDVRLGTYTPNVGVTINGSLGTRFLVDTGATGALVVNDYFRRKHPEAVVSESRDIQTRPLQGVGGGFNARYVTLAELELGGSRFQHFHAYVLDSPKLYATDEDGLIGPDLFELFNVFLDLPHGKVYLVPTESSLERKR